MGTWRWISYEVWSQPDGQGGVDYSVNDEYKTGTTFEMPDGLTDDQITAEVLGGGTLYRVLEDGHARTERVEFVEVSNGKPVGRIEREED